LAPGGQARTDPQATRHEVEDIFLPPFKAAISAALGKTDYVGSIE
jgi:hypothetical protein